MRPLLIRGVMILTAVSIAVIPACKIMPLGWEKGSSRDKRELVCFRGHSGTVSSVAFSPDGKMMLSTSADKTFRLWDVASGQQIRSESEKIENSRYVAPLPAGAVFSPDGGKVVYMNSDQRIREWDLKVEMTWEVPSFSSDSSQSALVVFAPDARLLASVGTDNTILVWNVSTGKKLQVLKGHSGQVNSVVFTPNNRLLSGSADGTIRLWDLNSGKELRTYRDNGGWILACSPSGFLAISYKAGGWGQEGVLQLWDLETGEPIRNLQGHVGPVNCAVFSPDGRRVLTGSGYGYGFPDSATSAEMEDRTMRLWDVGTGKELARYKGHSMGVTAVAFSPDGTRALSGSLDTTIRLWALPKEIPVENQ